MKNWWAGMGTIIDALHVVGGNWRNRHSALHLAIAAAKGCLLQAGVEPADLDLLINAGIYQDRNLGEPALAALIQDDIGAHPEDPHGDTHGTFSFDIANGTCGILTGLQIADGFLRSHTVSRVLVVTSDADPGRGTSERFPYSPVGAALLCRWSAGDDGVGRVHWLSCTNESFRATIAFEHSRNVLRVCQSEQIAVAADERMHTASLVAAVQHCIETIPAGERLLFTAATGGIVAGAALYRVPGAYQPKPYRPDG